MILLPIQYYASSEFASQAGRVSQQQIFQVVTLGLFAIYMVNNVYLASFLGLCLAQYAMYGFPVPIGVYVLTLLSCVILYEVTYRIVNRDNIHYVFNAMLWLGAINLLYMMMQGLGLELLFAEQSSKGTYQSQMIGFMCLKSTMGIFFAMMMPFLAYKHPRLALTLLIPIYLSESSIALAGGIAAYLWQIWHVSKRSFTILLVILTLGGAAYAYNDSHTGMFTDRVNMWRTSLRDAVKKPIIGWGADSFRCIQPDKQFMYWKNTRTLDTQRVDVRDTVEYQHTGKYDLAKYSSFMKEGDTLDPWDNPHNEYVQLFYEFGIAGVILLGLLIYDMRNKFKSVHLPYFPWMIPLTGFFIALGIICIAQFPLHLTKVGMFVPIFLACFYKLSDS
jgi:hypothetical protein